MHKAKLLFAAAFFVLAVVFANSCTKEPTAPKVKVSGFVITNAEGSIILGIGETFSIKWEIHPQEATNRTVSWNSSDENIASVDEDGLVTANDAGTAEILGITKDGGFSASFTVKVSAFANARFPDSGAEVPAYPTYNQVSVLADFPRIDITTDDGRSITSKTTYKSGKVSFKDPKQMYSEVTELSNLTMQIRGRGNTTWDLTDGGVKKNPYRFKLDEHNKVFGMKGDKDWILLADLQDPTLLRNAIALRMSRLVSMPWSPKFRCAELYINGTYQGCYLLVEAKEADRENKVPVTVVEAGQTDGGYYLEIDNKDDSDQYFTSGVFRKKIKYKDPEAPTEAQKNFIQNYIKEVETRLQNKKFTGEGSYKEMVEVETFIGNFIVNELAKNVDGNMRLSSYFAKDSDTGLFMPMCWDFDLAFGNASYLMTDFALTSNGPEGWFVKIRGGYPQDRTYDYYGRQRTYYQYMFEDPEFVQALKDRWEVVKPRLDMIPDFIDKMVEYNAVAYDNNMSKSKVSRSRSTNWRNSVSSLKTWYIQRLAWMDIKIKALQASDDIETDR